MFFEMQPCRQTNGTINRPVNFIRDRLAIGPRSVTIRVKVHPRRPGSAPQCLKAPPISAVESKIGLAGSG